MRLQDKTILVIGANGGIGGACVDQMLAEGARVIASDKSPNFKSSGNKNITYIPADMAEVSDIESLFREVIKMFGALDGFVYSSGIGSSSSFLNTSLEHYDNVMAVNLRGAFYSAKNAVNLMHNNGSIVLIASQKGLCGSTGSLAYNVSKSGMIIMSRSMAMELGASGIRVNCVCPGPTETAMFHQDMENQTDPGYAREKVKASNPLHKIADACEIAAGVCYLISDEASFITGTELVIDGGNIAGVRNL